MLLKLVVLSVCVLNCLAFSHIRHFGSILSKTLSKNRYLGSEKITKMPNALDQNRVAFAFPKDREDNTDYVIKGIQQIDHTKHPAKVDFIEGGIGSKKVIMQVTAPEGAEIGSEFHFYGQRVSQNGEDRFKFWDKSFFPKVEKSSDNIQI